MAGIIRWQLSKYCWQLSPIAMNAANNAIHINANNLRVKRYMPVIPVILCHFVEAPYTNNNAVGEYSGVVKPLENAVYSQNPGYAYATTVCFHSKVNRLQVSFQSCHVLPTQNIPLWTPYTYTNDVRPACYTHWKIRYAHKIIATPVLL